MADRADVGSIEGLEAFHQRLQHLRQKLLLEMEALGLELRRLSNWLTNDVCDYWQGEVRQAQRRLNEANASLTRCMSYVREDERRPCTEEKKRVRLAQARLELCSEKMRTAQAAVAFWQAEISKLSSGMHRVSDMAESDWVVAANQLAEQITTLKTYASLRTAEVPRPSRGQDETH